MSTTPEMTITRLVPWFGANAANAHAPSRMLAECKWVYVPFAGSMCEIPHFGAGVQLMVSDLHDDLINLARIVSDKEKRSILVDRLATKLFHPAMLEQAQLTLSRARQNRPSPTMQGLFASVVPFECGIDDDIDIAEAYFTAAWMGRSAVSGTKGEDRVGLALRYDGGGGDPVKRFDSAVASLDAWHNALRRCQFTREDAFEVIARLHAKVSAAKFETKATGNRIGCYCDAPWPDDGDGYLYAFTEAQQRQLATALSTLPHAQIVVRFGDHPLIRALYPESLWEWRMATGRDQNRKGKAEVFLFRRDRGFAS